MNPQNAGEYLDAGATVGTIHIICNTTANIGSSSNSLFSFSANFISLCIRIAGVFLFIPQFGILGYLIGLLVSQIVLFSLCLLRLNFYLHT